MDAFIRYWTVQVPTKTPFEIAGELWLLSFPNPFGSNGEFMTWRCLRFHRWYLLVATFLVDFCCGAFLAFPMLGPTMDLLFVGHVTAGHDYVLNIEYSACVFYSFIGMVCGPALERRSPRVGMVVGSVLMVAGLIVSHIAVSHASFGLLVVGYGAFLGTGTIFVHLTAVSTTQKWFPDYRGIAMGICCSGFAAGFSGWSVIFLFTIGSANGISTETVGRVFPIALLIMVPILILAVVVIRSPPPMYIVNGLDVHCIAVDPTLPGAGYVQEEFLNCGMTLVNYDAMRVATPRSLYYQQVKALSLAQCIVSTDFLLLYFAFSISSLPEVAFAAKLTEVTAVIFTKGDKEKTSAIAMTTIGATAVGRLIAPSMSDALIRGLDMNPGMARKIAFMFFLGVECIVIFRLKHSVETLDLSEFEWTTALLAFTCGSAYSTVPCFLIDLYGVYNMGTMYGIMVTSGIFVLLSVGLSQANNSIDDPVILASHLNTIGYLLIVSWFLMWLVRTNSADRFYPGYQITLFGKVLVQIPFASLQSVTATTADPFLDLSSPPRASVYHWEVDDVSVVGDTTLVDSRVLERTNPIPF
ncbi:Major Facilitator Superfamily (MFS) [Achlya hypogyna]|uniref:Major Facilitator Superfamily (MFS) n=1 Tax=Achlya hypogyna TaxID=1202772 RepID=A0A1V9ZPJ0_ACHHY|nr:Major Facilitator Superfamily (MFS) [Achlya hypogyna]